MSQLIKGKPLVATAEAVALPEHAMPCIRNRPLAILYTGSWAFRRGAWVPNLLTPQLVPGVNAVTQDPGADLDVYNFSSTVRNRGNTHRLITNGADGRLGEYKNFIHSYDVRLKNKKLTQHYALLGETYMLTRMGRVQVLVDHAWFKGLYAKLIKESIIPEMGYEDLLNQLAKVDTQIKEREARIAKERDAHILSIHNEKRDQLVALRKEMEAAFEDQFPGAKQEYMSFEPAQPKTDGSYADDDEVI